MIEVKITKRQVQFAVHDWARDSINRCDCWCQRVSDMGNIPNTNTYWIWHFRHSEDAVMCTLRFA